ncbi:hypothetical protein OC846_000679 [Tilletia horrida]|uniref:AAA+ ATPase domain-containing protein n=1 Tax=Tilletia horrida TaxID=155126 RepID=A0AAN6GUK3_9BASI|nr:hypothetical protein OC845_000812 [Tilletia horrida]KAK0557228.1 hypothetical protein OC846_000679 [Tilletia horrida]
MTDDSTKAQSNGTSSQSSQSQQQQPAQKNKNTTNTQSTTALLQQLAQRYGFIASLANPVGGLALGALSAAGANSLTNPNSEEGASDSSGEDAGPVTPFTLAQNVLASLTGSGSNTGGLRLLLIGFFIAYARSLLDNASTLVRRFFVTTVELGRDNHTPSYFWVQRAIRKAEIGKRLNRFTVEAHSAEEDEAIARGQDLPLIEGLPMECEVGFFINPKTGKIYPSFFDALRLRNRSGGKVGRLFRRLQLACMRVVPFTPHALTYAWLDSRKEERKTPYGNEKYLSDLSTLSRSRTPLEEFLKHARFLYSRENTNKTRVYVSDPNDRSWEMVTSRPKRLFSSVLLEGRTQEALLSDIRAFLSKRMRSFYAQRGVPHRRGYLLYGPPGSGKTSSIVAIAGELNLNVYALSLAQKGLDEQLLIELAGDCETPCILLLEDIDAAFVGRSRTDAGGAEDEQKKEGDTIGSENRVTFSALLQLLDGAASSENRVVFATTNHIERLDPALIRPGRIDVRVEYRNASRRQARGLFMRIFTTLSAQELDERLIEAKRAYEETVAHHAELGSPVRSRADAAPTSNGNATSPTVQVRKIKGPSDPDFEDSIFHPALVKLANEFAAQIPERKLSMAQLQGFLIKRAMSAQQDARSKAAAAASKAGRPHAEEVRVPLGQEKKSDGGGDSESEKKGDGFVIGVKREEDSVELKMMLGAARRAVAEVGAFVAGEADNVDVGVSL